MRLGTRSVLRQLGHLKNLCVLLCLRFDNKRMNFVFAGQKYRMKTSFSLRRRTMFRDKILKNAIMRMTYETIIKAMRRVSAWDMEKASESTIIATPR